MPEMPDFTSTTTTLPPPWLDQIQLSGGKHTRRQNGVCATETLAWLAGEPHSDTPQSVCPAICDLLRIWNDQLSQLDRDQLLRPLLPNLLNTNQGPQATQHKRDNAQAHLLQVTTPLWLTAAGAHRQAKLIRDIPNPPVNTSQAQDILQTALQDLADSQDHQQPPAPQATAVAHHTGSSGLQAILRTVYMGYTPPAVTILVSLAQELSLSAAEVALQDATLPPDPPEHTTRNLIQAHQQDTLRLLRQMADPAGRNHTTDPPNPPRPG